MPKVNLNPRNNYLSPLGILDLHDSWLNQSVRTYASPTFSNVTVTNNANIGANLVVQGDLTVNGNYTLIDSIITQIKDNIILINSEETGAGVTAGLSGIEIDRGTLPNYQFVYEESDQYFKVGQIGNLQVVATREENPLDKGVTVYNATTKMLVSTQNIQLPITFSAGNNSTSASTGTIIVEGGAGISGNVSIDGSINLFGTNYNNFISSDNSNDIIVSSGNNIIFQQTSGTQITIPTNVSLTFGNSQQSIYSNGTSMIVTNSAGGDLTFLSMPNINIPIGTFLKWNPSNTFRYDGTNMVLTSSGNFTIVPVINSTNTTASTSPTVGSVLVAGSIAISNTTNATSYTSGGTLTSAGGAAIGLKLFVGDQILTGQNSVSTTQVAGQGINFASASRTLTTVSTADTVFNSFSAGVISTSGTITNSSTVYISGPPTITGGGSITNPYSLLVDSGDTKLGGKLYVLDSTASSSSTVAATVLTGGLSISNTTNATSSTVGGGITNAGGLAVAQDAYFGGKVDTGNTNITLTQVSGQGINFRSRNKILTTVSTADVAFNTFEGGSVNSSSTIANGTTLYVTGSPTISGGGSITNSYSLWVNSGTSKFSGTILSNLATVSTSSTVGAVLLSGGIAISLTNDATSSTNGGTLTSAGGGAFAKSIYSGLGMFTNVGTGNNHYNLLSGNLLRFSLGLTNTETGSNNGSDFYINNYTDAGGIINTVLSIKRSTGVITIPLSTASTSTAVGALLMNGGISIANTTEAVSSTNGGTFTTGGGVGIGKSLFVGVNLGVTGTSNLNIVNIDTNNGVFGITGTNGISASVAGNSSIAVTAGNLGLSSSGTTSVSGTNGVSVTSSSGSVNLSASSNSSYTVSAGSLSLTGTSLSLNGGSGAITSTTTGDTTFNTATFTVAASDLTNGVKIATSTANVPVTIGNAISNVTVGDNLIVNGDLTVNGTTTTVNSTIVTVSDNAIVVNNSPNGISDGGFLVRRYQTPVNSGNGGEVVQDTPFQTSTFGTGSATPGTLVLNNSANSADAYYQGWWIKITSGAGAGQIRRIDTYVGSTRTASLYTTSNNNANNDGLDLVTAPAAGDSYALYNCPYVGMFFDETLKQVVFSGVAFDPSSGQFPVPTSYYPIHVETIVTEQGFTTNGNVQINGQLSVNDSSTQAFTVNSLFTVDTVNNQIDIFNSTGSLNTINLQNYDSSTTKQNFAMITTNVLNNTPGNLEANLILSVQNYTGGLEPFLTLTGGTTSYVDVSSNVNSFRVLGTTASTSTSSGCAIFGGGISLESTTNATSVTSGGSLTAAGGAAIAGTTFIGGELNVLSTNSIGNANSFTGTEAAINVDGDISLYNTSGSKIVFDGGVGVPSFTTRSAGTKIILAPAIASNSVDYALGIASNCLWYSSASTSTFHAFYLGTTEAVAINNTGVSTLQSGYGFTLSNGTNTSSFLESSNVTVFKPFTSSTTQGLQFWDSTSTSQRVRINSDGQLTLGITGYSGTPGISGSFLNNSSSTFTDNSTAVSGTATNFTAVSWNQPTLSATNTSVTTTNAVNMYVQGAVIKGTNETITNSYGIYVDNSTALISSGTISKAASIYVNGAPTVTGTGVVVNSYAVLVNQGISQFNDVVNCTGNVSVGSSNTLAGALNITNGDITLNGASAQAVYFGTGTGAPTFTTRSTGSKLILGASLSASAVDTGIGIDSENLWYSVPTTSFTHQFYLGTSLRVTIDNSGQIFNSSGSGVSTLLRPGTSSGSDNSGILLLGGGASGSSRGAQIEVYGNQNTGNLVLSSGTGTITFNANGSPVGTFSTTGVLTLNATTDSTSTSTGSLIVPGGVGIGKSLFVGTALDLAFNQTYTYTGNANGNLLIQAGSSGITSKSAYFTKNGNNDADNVIEIYGTGTPSGLTNTEYLRAGFELATTAYCIRSSSAGTGTARPLNLETQGNTGQISLLTNNTVTFSGTTASTSSTVGSIVLAGSIAINNTTNASAITNGGTLTSGGGAAFAKDVYIGGNLNVYGSVSIGISTPTVTFSNLVNITGSVTQVNTINRANGSTAQLSIGFRFTPTSSSIVTSFDFTIPGMSSNFVNIYDVLFAVNGYYNDSSPSPVENITGFAVTGTQTGRILLTSSSTVTTTVQATLSYTVY